MIIFASEKVQDDSDRLREINFTLLVLAASPRNLALDGPSEVEQSLRLLAGIVTLEQLWIEAKRQSLSNYGESAIYDKAASYSCLLYFYPCISEMAFGALLFCTQHLDRHRRRKTLNP